MVAPPRLHNPIEKPIQLSVPFLFHFHTDEKVVLDIDEATFCSKGIVLTLHSDGGGGVSNIFPRSKSIRDVQFLLDLTLLHEFNEYKHVKTFSLDTARDLIVPAS